MKMDYSFVTMDIVFNNRDNAPTEFTVAKCHEELFRTISINTNLDVDVCMLRVFRNYL